MQTTGLLILKLSSEVFSSASTDANCRHSICEVIDLKNDSLSELGKQLVCAR